MYGCVSKKGKIHEKKSKCAKKRLRQSEQTTKKKAIQQHYNKPSRIIYTSFLHNLLIKRLIVKPKRLNHKYNKIQYKQPHTNAKFYMHYWVHFSLISIYQFIHVLLYHKPNVTYTSKFVVCVYNSLCSSYRYATVVDMLSLRRTHYTLNIGVVAIVPAPSCRLLTAA